MARALNKADAKLTLSSALYYREPFTIFFFMENPSENYRVSLDRMLLATRHKRTQ